MASIVDVVAYIVVNYPHKHELSNARLTKMVYLADWHSSIHHHRQITPIRWFFDNYGPYVRDVMDEVSERPDLFEVVQTANLFGQDKTLVRALNEEYTCPSLTTDDKESLNRVIDATQDLYWDDFIKFVYSTHPIISSRRYSSLDLPAKAIEYTAAKTGNDDVD